MEEKTAKQNDSLYIKNLQETVDLWFDPQTTEEERDILDASILSVDQYGELKNPGIFREFQTRLLNITSGSIESLNNKDIILPVSAGKRFASYPVEIQETFFSLKYVNTLFFSFFTEQQREDFFEAFLINIEKDPLQHFSALVTISENFLYKGFFSETVISFLNKALIQLKQHKQFLIKDSLRRNMYADLLKTTISICVLDLANSSFLLRRKEQKETKQGSRLIQEVLKLFRTSLEELNDFLELSGKDVLNNYFSFQDYLWKNRELLISLAKGQDKNRLDSWFEDNEKKHRNGDFTPLLEYIEYYNSLNLEIKDKVQYTNVLDFKDDESLLLIIQKIFSELFSLEPKVRFALNKLSENTDAKRCSDDFDNEETVCLLKAFLSNDMVKISKNIISMFKDSSRSLYLLTKRYFDYLKQDDSKNPEEMFVVDKKLFLELFEHIKNMERPGLFSGLIGKYGEILKSSGRHPQDCSAFMKMHEVLVKNGTIEELGIASKSMFPISRKTTSPLVKAYIKNIEESLELTDQSKESFPNDFFIHSQVAYVFIEFSELLSSEQQKRLIEKFLRFYYKNILDRENIDSKNSNSMVYEDFLFDIMVFTKDLSAETKEILIEQMGKTSGVFDYNSCFNIFRNKPNITKTKFFIDLVFKFFTFDPKIQSTPKSSFGWPTCYETKDIFTDPVVHIRQNLSDKDLDKMFSIVLKNILADTKTCSTELRTLLNFCEFLLRDFKMDDKDKGFLKTVLEWREKTTNEIKKHLTVKDLASIVFYDSKYSNIYSKHLIHSTEDIFKLLEDILMQKNYNFISFDSSVYNECESGEEKRNVASILFFLLVQAKITKKNQLEIVDSISKFRSSAVEKFLEKITEEKTSNPESSCSEVFSSFRFFNAVSFISKKSFVKFTEKHAEHLLKLAIESLVDNKNPNSKEIEMFNDFFLKNKKNIFEDSQKTSSSFIKVKSKYQTLLGMYLALNRQKNLNITEQKDVLDIDEPYYL